MVHEERDALPQDRYPLIYAGSVKNVRTHPGHPDEAIFEFTDAYSVFDWGKMPDAIPDKGAALQALAIAFFERLEDASAWSAFFDSPAGREFSCAADTEILRRAAGDSAEIERLHALFREESEEIRSGGLRTHYRGVTPAGIRVERLAAVRPTLTRILGETVPDYFSDFGRNAPATLVPLEVVFRFELTGASSLLARKPAAGFRSGQRFEFPYVECFTKLEDSDRALELPEALAVGRIDAGILERILVRTAFTAAFLKHAFGVHGLALLDGKFEWGLDAGGALVLADAIGPDELRLTLEGVSLSKEILREHFRGSAWHLDVEKQKALVGERADWHSLVRTVPDPLPAEPLSAVADLYRSLANAIAGRAIFEAPSLSDTATRLARLRRA